LQIKPSFGLLPVAEPEPGLVGLVGFGLTPVPEPGLVGFGLTPVPDPGLVGFGLTPVPDPGLVGFGLTPVPELGLAGLVCAVDLEMRASVAARKKRLAIFMVLVVL